MNVTADRREPSPFLRRFGQQLAEHRRWRHLTQRDLAEGAGLSRASIANIEAGRQEPGIQKLIMLAAVLDIAIDELMSCPPGQHTLTGGQADALTPALAEAEAEHRAQADLAWTQHRHLDVLHHRAHADGLAQAQTLARTIHPASSGAAAPWKG